MSKPEAAPADQPFVHRNPGITATIFTILVAVGFIAMLYRTATTHEPSPSHEAPAGH